jgi:cytochrome P450
VAEDYELNGHRFRKGDKVGLFYVSANRDEAVFENPDVFDITRSPNPHVSFGGPGPHYCLGAHLAKRSMLVLFRELFDVMPGLRAAGPIQPLVSSFNNGVQHMPYEFAS